MNKTGRTIMNIQTVRVSTTDPKLTMHNEPNKRVKNQVLFSNNCDNVFHIKLIILFFI